jgi:hypothetical protein
LWCAGGRDFTLGLGRAGAGVDAEVVVGANPEVTDSGSPARPMGVAASWLADQATVAVATMPSSAAVTHISVWRFTVRASYSALG